MTSHLSMLMLPARFIERYRPVKSHRHEMALGGYFFDPNAARFFIRLATIDPVPADALWAVLPPEASGRFRIISGIREDLTLGYIICQLPPAAGDALEYPLVRQLTYRARLRLAILQSLLADIHEAGPLVTVSEIAAGIQHRIEELTA